MNEYLIHFTILKKLELIDPKLYSHICLLENACITKSNNSKQSYRGLMVMKKYKYSLHDWIISNKNNHNLEQILLEILLQIVYIIHNLEEKFNFVYRDLKTTNLLIDKFGIDENEKIFLINGNRYKIS